MKRLRKILACLFAFLMMVCGFAFFKPQTTFALAENTSQIESEIYDELLKFVQHGETERERVYRTPGSKAEYYSAMYIRACMSFLSNFEAVNNLSTKDGVQSFEFVSETNGMTKVSQNIVFRKPTETASKKKIILATHYDSSPRKNTFEKSEETGKIISASEGVNESGASVATLLAFAKYLNSAEDAGFTIEIVFFGASNNSYAGSKFYMQDISDADAKDILAVINIDKIGLGDFNYFYVNEFSSSQTKFVSKMLPSFKNLQLKNVMHFSEESPNGLSYTHVGLESDHAVFMAKNINVINFFSGSYEKFVTVGLNEYDGKDNITYTINDTIDVVEGNANFKQNLANVYSALQTLIFDNNFVVEMEKDNGSADFYGVYLNDKLAVFITIVLFMVMSFVFVLIFHALQNKSKKTLNGHNLDKIVIKIAKNIGDDSEELNDFIDQKLKNDTEEVSKENQKPDEKSDKDNK